ncbi:MAG: sulfotransferase family protein [Bacteroidales bacterium]|nr:sulfotransferase family protein [Bacteroidales bacterium]
MNIKAVKRQIIFRRSNFLTRSRRIFASILFSLLRNNSGDKYVFLHIPKCGGTSVRKALSNWFSFFVRDTHFSTNSKEFKYPNPIKGIERLPSNFCLTGHFNVPGGFLFQRYPIVFEDQSFKVFTFIRDPFSHKLSQWNYLSYKRHYSFDKKFEEYILDETNYFARLLGCNENNFKERIDQFFFVGITEEIQLSMDILANKLGKKKVVIQHKNVSPKKETAIDNKLLERFKQIRSLDYKVYNYCLKKFYNDKNIFLKNET